MIASMVGGLITAFKGLWVALGALRLAWAALNAAFLMSPLGLILAGVAAVIAAIGISFTDWSTVLSDLADTAWELVKPFVELSKAIASAVGGLVEMSGMREKGTLANTASGAAWNPMSSIRKDAREYMDRFKEMGTENRSFMATGLAVLLEKIAAPGGDKKEREELAPRLGGFESVEQTYRRIAEASIKVGGGATKTPEEQAVEQLKDIYRLVERLDREVARQKPPTTQ
jgi:hypothetical protein